MKRKPNFFIIGAAKCGTTSLNQYLCQHPDIYMAPRKETHFFAIPDMPERFQGPGDEVYMSNLIRTEAEYLALFDNVQGESAVGESSVGYLFYPKSAERIARWADDPKFIVILRHPVDRAYSAYMHLIRDGRETLSFAEGWQAEPQRLKNDYQPLWMYRQGSTYFPSLQRYFEIFGKDRVMVILYDDFKRQPAKVLRQIFSFLGVREDVPIDTSMRFNVTGIPRGPLYQWATSSNAFTRLVKPLIPAKIRHKIRLTAVRWSLNKIPLDEENRRHYLRAFEDDIYNVECLIGRNTGWLATAGKIEYL
ncbi:hypothetical protein GCM10010885_11070 [Alicyclobacillus cellulosilyticus]|uniref:Sulfotransferase family protein n=1 Tax=Alicyclobacillus cellulosilyticus TaxID=1003997 RepID=A0A917NIF4_9BACL|nr:sulfotransferase [Alicyclobacillus cellulosilyticus]GGJ03578.1 hypothetical protein GCM10010885_11070 [Alicyclobacillus cellulosilyticus]